ncbi:hypothetical protein HUS23_08500 [Ectothiorhodospiraceae bacterium 2226]|nr:hypothetical protein HUS23_08500 [Ectothiorhodospiraceae bacterium 2226]
MLLAALAVLLGMVSQEAQASHFRFGHVYWESRPEVSPNTVEFMVVVAFRRNGYRGTAPDGRVQVGDIMSVATGGLIKPRLNFGDGSVSSVLEFVVTAYSVEENWAIGLGRVPGTAGPGILKTYAAPTAAGGSPWTAFISDDCRLTSIRNYSCRYRVETKVNLASSHRSPRSNLPSIVSCGRGRTCQFHVPATQEVGIATRWRLSTRQESGIATPPGPPYSQAPLTVDSLTGVVTWEIDSTTPLGLYSTAVTMESSDNGVLTSASAIEFLVHVVDEDVNQPPAFDVPPTPQANETISVPIGAPLEFVVQAGDPDLSDNVTLNHVGLPNGAEFIAAPGNPATATFRWTPTEAQLGEHLVTFTAIDNRGRAALPHQLRIAVIDPAIRDVSVVAEVNDDNLRIAGGSFTRPPTQIDQHAGFTRVEWYFPTLTPQDAEDLNFTVDLQAPIGGERRLVTRTVFLEYTDINGNRIRQELDPQYVDVLPGIFAVDVATDRPVYGASETAQISSTLDNLSRFTATAQVDLAVVDEVGALVADLGLYDAPDLLSGESRAFEHLTFETGMVYMGHYGVRARALDATGIQVAEAFAPFEIRADLATSVGAQVGTDRPLYQAGETVEIRDRVHNLAANLLMQDLRVDTAVRDPAGEALWEASASLAQLRPNTFSDLVYNLPLGRAAPGTYSITLDVHHPDGALAARDITTFEVASTAETGVGLAGDVSAYPMPVLRTERVALAYRVTNDGNAPLSDLPITLSILDMATEQVYASWTRELASLAQGATADFDQAWDAVVPSSGGQYVAVLTAQVGDEQRILATAPVLVAEKLETAILPEYRGRLLALVDGPTALMDAEACPGAQELEFALSAPVGLHADHHVTVDLYDAAGGLLDQETAVVGGFHSAWMNRGAEGRFLALSRLDAGRLQWSLMNLSAPAVTPQLRVAVTVQGPEGDLQFDSGYFTHACAPGEADSHGDFTLINAWGADAADPLGPRDAASLATQRRYLEAMLRARGWAYTLVSSAEAFEQQFDAATYTAYALFSEHIKLPEALLHALVDAVDQGAGLLVAGAHDQRNGRVDQSLGIDFRGRLPNIAGIEVDPHGTFAGGNAEFLSGLMPLRARLAGAAPVATYTPPPPNGEATAAAHHSYGDGRSAYIGFDVLAEGALTGSAFHAGLLDAALMHVVGVPPTPAARGLAIEIRNHGHAADGELILPAAFGVQVLDLGLARLDSAGNLVWAFHLEEGGIARLPLWLRREPDGPDEVAALLRITTTGGVLVDYGTVIVPLP